jgi:hypothetical protein
MSVETLFSGANLLALAGWLLLLAVPRNRIATTVAGTAIPLLLAVVYLVVLAMNWGNARGSFSTLHGVAELFANPWLLLAGWVHYLAFDLFVGTWEARDAMANGVPRWLLVPSLLLTFMFGPVGFLTYSATRRSRKAGLVQE